MTRPSNPVVLATWLVICLLTACAGDPNVHADAMAQPAGLQRNQVQAGAFVLTTYSRITRIDQPLTVYIEGDGLAWRSRNQASDDPTPHRALGLSLAVADGTSNVVYLARPCQFTPMTANPRCAVTYWTDKRYAEEVVTSMNIAVTQYLQRLPGQRVNLVGYSGGGALAVLIAARRDDVASLRTVAGNLDHVAVNRLHQVSPMPVSLNAIDVAGRVATIPQLHISGDDDKVVPTSVTRTFVAAVGSCAQLRVVEGMAHESDWAGKWPALLSTPLSCS
ncbi:alpha/beta hydrolase [Rhodoferax sp. U11-2br]|uniref:alpha/beta hydrolase n=1 Tax=Rhodoferax sp. U11-2br TaxID=2838878 RepID=UPI001BE6148F|nr:alpha/beta hydrolase [Rhodoferax sp. U11-2br]MBT3068762.1 alpha/beta hydrolase [Rhodoferax sp. U11-2br]